MSTYERKVNEVFTEMEVDPKRALRLIQKEIDSRGKKLDQTMRLNLKMVRSMVLDRNNRLEEAKEEVMEVLAEIKRDKLADQFVLETFRRTTSQMKDSRFFDKVYLELVSELIQSYPKNKELTETLY